MSELESLKQLNSLKELAINDGGYEKHRTMILLACELHKEKFGKDYTPKQLKQ
jgi:hypothetical protein